MNIAIVYYSHTGHTKKVAVHLASFLENIGHTISQFALKTVSKIDFQAEMVPIESNPIVDGFDVIMLGSPVHGGRISAPIRAFLEAQQTFNAKNIILLVTHFFKKGWGQRLRLTRPGSFANQKVLNLWGQPILSGSL